MSLVSSPGILVRSHPYSETSRILRFMTPGHGIVAVVGKGVRRGSAKGGSPLDTFQEGTLTFAHRPGRDLHTLTEFQPSSERLPLGRDVRRFIGASLLAELLLAHTLEEGDPELYQWVRDGLARIARVPREEVPAAILAGGWKTLSHFGFAPELDRCVRCGRPVDEGGGEEEDGVVVRLDVAAGGLRCAACSGGGPRIGPAAREQLRSLVVGNAPRPLSRPRAHFRILEEYALYHLGRGRPFHSFGILLPLLAEG